MIGIYEISNFECVLNMVSGIVLHPPSSYVPNNANNTVYRNDVRIISNHTKNIKTHINHNHILKNVYIDYIYIYIKVSRLSLTFKVIMLAREAEESLQIFKVSPAFKDTEKQCLRNSFLLFPKIFSLGYSKHALTKNDQKLHTKTL